MATVDFFHREFRSDLTGFPDLLRYDSVIRPGVVLGKGGELISTFKYRGPDMQCASHSDLNYMRMRVGEMVKKLRGGWMLHSTTLRKESISYTESLDFPDPVTQAIEHERMLQYRKEGDHYENDYFLTFTYLPPSIMVSKIKEFAYDRTDTGHTTPARIAARSVEYFERQVQEYVDVLETGMGTSLTRLTAREEMDSLVQRPVLFDDQLAFLHTCISGKSMPIRLPKKAIPTGVDYLIGSYPFTPGIIPVFNGKKVRVVAIEGLPDVGTHLGILEVLNQLGVEFRWTTRWIASDPEKAKARTNKIRSMWRQKVRGFFAEMFGRTSGPINQDAANMASDAEAVLTDLESGDVSYGFWASTVVLMNKDTAYLEASVRYLIKNVEAQGFPCRSEEENTNEALLGSLPGHGYENVRNPEIHSMNLVDCLPLTSTWQGPVSNPCPFYKKLYRDGVAPPLFQGSASGGTPFRVVLHNGDLGHTFIVGPPGAGKSTLLGLIAASHFRYPRARFFGFEKGESMLALCAGARGTHYNFLDEQTAESAAIGFSPFVLVDRLTDRAWAADYLETILLLNDVKVDNNIRADLSKALDLLSTRPVDMRSITHLVALIPNKQIADVLKTYEEKMAGGMLNAKMDTISTSKFTVFEMEKLMGMNDKHVVPVLLYLFRMIERTLDGAPTIICLDEAWLMLKHPLFQEKIVEWLKTLRKANALVIFATQELEDVANSPIASTIFSACQTKILLPNKEAQNDIVIKLYRTIGLSEREIELLAGATPKRDYFFTSPAGRRLFQLELGPVAMSFVAASGVEERKMVKDLRNTYGDNWTGHWLRHRGVDPAVLGSKATLAMAA